MLHNKFEMPLDLEVQSSRLFIFYLYCISLFSIVSVFISSLLFSVKLLLVVLLFVYITYAIKKLKLNKVTKINLSAEDNWTIESNTQTFEVELQGECIVTRFLVWLNFTTCNSFGRREAFHVLLLPDSAERDLLRQLRVRLRFLKNKVEEVEEEKCY